LAPGAPKNGGGVELNVTIEVGTAAILGLTMLDDRPPVA
jgi:hypothetical protein